MTLLGPLAPPTVCSRSLHLLPRSVPCRVARKGILVLLVGVLGMMSLVWGPAGFAFSPWGSGGVTGSVVLLTAQAHAGLYSLPRAGPGRGTGGEIVQQTPPSVLGDQRRDHLRAGVVAAVSRGRQLQNLRANVLPLEASLQQPGHLRLLGEPGAGSLPGGTRSNPAASPPTARKEQKGAGSWTLHIAVPGESPSYRRGNHSNQTHRDAGGDPSVLGMRWDGPDSNGLISHS